MGGGHDLVPAGGLGLVEPFVGAAQEFRGRLAGPTAQPPLMVTAMRWSPAMTGVAETALRIRSAVFDDAVQVGAGQDDEELLAAPPSGDVLEAEFVLEPTGELAEHVVADGVSVRVVDAA